MKSKQPKRVNKVKIFLIEDSGLGLQELHCNGLGLQIVVQTILAEFAANAGVLVAAEGCLWQDGIVAVDPDGAGVDAVGVLHGLVDVVGNDARSKTIFDIIGSFNHLIDGAEFENRLNGTEDLSGD